MELAFSNISSNEIIKLPPVNYNRILFLKKIIFDSGIDHIFNIILSITCKIPSLKGNNTFKFLRKLPLGNYQDINDDGHPGVLMNEKIILPPECKLVDFEVQSPVHYDFTLECAVI